MFIGNQTCCEDDSEKCDQAVCKEKIQDDCKDKEVVISCPVLCGKCTPGNIIFL